MSVVVDASFAMTWVLEDEVTADTDAVLDSLGQGAKAFVPALWRWEVGNVLVTIERQKRVTHAAVGHHLAFFDALPIEVDEASWHHAWNATLALARKHRLSSYDASYLELAMRRGLPLASLDKELRAAARLERVRVLPAK